MPERQPDKVLWQSSRGAEFVRYALSFIFVFALGAALVLVTLKLRPSGQVVSDDDDAVLFDLAPAVASSAPERDVAQGPERQAADAAPEVRPEAIEPPAESKALDEELPDEAQKKPPEKPRDPPKPEVTPPAPPSAAAQAQDESGASGSAAPTKDQESTDPEAMRARATRAITLWQKSMLRRIEIARNGMRTNGEYGSVEIAFSIARDGALTVSRIDRRSGSSRLDQAALALVRRASPFPAPPASATSKQLIFKVPIVFARQR